MKKRIFSLKNVYDFLTHIYFSSLYKPARSFAESLCLLNDFYFIYILIVLSLNKYPKLYFF